LGIARVMVFFCVYLGLMIFMLGTIELRTDEPLFFSLALQLGVQSFFMAGLGFLSMVLIRNAGWALFIPLIYTLIQLYTGGEIATQTVIFFFNRDVLHIDLKYS
jgi:hypothetical protein